MKTPGKLGGVGVRDGYTWFRFGLGLRLKDTFFWCFK